MNLSHHVCPVYQFSLKSGQGQFFGILVAILKITAKLEIPKFRKHPSCRNLFLSQIWLRNVKTMFWLKSIKLQCTVLFLEIVILTFDPQTSSSWDLFLSAWGMCVLSFLYLRYCAETKKVSNFCSIFRSCDLDLWPTNLNINRLPPLTIKHVCTKIHLDPTFRS